MRRKDKQVTDRNVLDEILREGELVHLALFDGENPYALCMNYGYDGKALYLHGAKQGRKMDIFAAHPKVSFNVVLDYQMIKNEDAGEFTSHFRSVVGEGHVEVLENLEDKRYGLDVLMASCAPGEDYDYGDQLVARTAVMRIVIDSLDGKISGY